MENLSDSRKKEVLPEFQAFLLDKKLAQEKNVFFYALWASKFLIYSNKKHVPPDQYQENAVIEFIESLKADPNMSIDKPFLLVVGSIRNDFLCVKKIWAQHVGCERNDLFWDLSMESTCNPSGRYCCL